MVTTWQEQDFYITVVFFRVQVVFGFLYTKCQPQTMSSSIRSANRIEL